MKSKQQNWGNGSPANARNRGISLVEMILTVVVIGFVATISIMAVGNVSKNAQYQKAETDVLTLNAAIKMYLANGGSLDSLATADQVLTKLKSSRTKGDKKIHVGAPSGKMVDPRVTTRAIAEDSWKKGATYNSTSKRFEIAMSGERFEFVLDDTLNEFSGGTEAREHGPVKYAQNASWVWDHAALRNPDNYVGPDQINTGTAPVDGTPGEDVPDDPDPGDDDDDDDDGPGTPDPPLPPRLPTPVFSIPAGGHPDIDFPLSVEITNVPAPSDGTVVFRKGGGAWEVYSGAIETLMNTTLRAQFLTADPDLFRDSYTRSSNYYPVPTSLSGTVDGAFQNITGGPNLVYDITSGGKNFSHGDPVYLLDGIPVNTGDPNVLTFTPGTFSDVVPGEKFTLGSLFYHNGSSYYDSHATHGELALSISLPDLGETVNFTLQMDMVNTSNDPDDLAASADYVKILNLTQNLSLNINGVAYQIHLEFGATDSFGFSSTSQFHVYEGATGQGEILGTFIASP